MTTPFGETQRQRVETGEDRLPPGQRLVRDWPVLTYGGTPVVETADWTFSVWGAIAKERTWSYEEFLQIGLEQRTNDIHCVTHWSRYDNEWEGVLFKDLLADLDVNDGVDAVMFHCYGGYTTNVRLEELMADDHAMFAIRHDGQPLAPEHGGPVRAVVPSLYFWKSAKWVGGMEFLSKDQPGFWEMYGYHMRGDPWTEERYG